MTAPLPMIAPATIRRIMRGGAALETEECRCADCRGEGAPQFRREGARILEAQARVTADGRAQVWL